MRRSSLLNILIVVASPSLAFAQYTAATATIQDSSGNPYANCSYTASFVGQNTVPGHPDYTLGGVPSGQFQRQIQGQCSSAAGMSTSLADNNQISPTPSQWNFNICDQTGKYCFQSLCTVTGSSDNVSTCVNANAVLLPSAGGNGITSINGDTKHAQLITGSGIISASTVSGTTTISGSAITGINGDHTAAQTFTGINGISVSTTGGTTTINGSGGGGVPVPLDLIAGPSVSADIFNISENTTGTYSGNTISANMLSTGTGGFSGNFLDMMVNGTAKYTLDNSGQSIQHGGMYSSTVDTTVIADMKCNTPFSLDDSCITNAISALPSTGGIVNLSAGSYTIANTITISKPVILQGAGASINCTQTGCSTVSPPFLPATKLSWSGTTNVPMFSITPSTGNVAVGNVNLRDIAIDGNATSGFIGIDANCMQQSKWGSISISRAAVGLVLECRTGTNAMLNTFLETEMNLVGVGIVMDGPYSGACSTGCGDTFDNIFVHTHIVYTGSAGIDIKSADNNQFLDLTVYRQSGSAAGIIFEAPSGSGTTLRLGGTYTYIDHYQPPLTAGATFNAGGNVIQNWDIANGQALPSWTGSPNHNFVSVTNGTNTTWVTDTGGIYLYDPNPSDSTPSKGLLINNGHFQMMSNNHANVLLDIDDSGNTMVANGSNTVYRCSGSGTLPAGTLTTVAGNCGTANDTGLRVK